MDRAQCKHEQWWIAWCVLIVSQSMAAGGLIGALYGGLVAAPFLKQTDITQPLATINEYNITSIGGAVGVAFGATFSLFAWSIMPRFRRRQD